MLNKISIVQKLILLLFFLSVQFIYATDLENPFIKNKGQLPQKVIAKVCLPGGALFIEKGIFTYHFYNQQKLADIHNHRTTDRSIKAHAFKVIFKNANENIESFLEEKSEFFENYYLGNNQNNWAENVRHCLTPKKMKFWQKNYWKGCLKLFFKKKHLLFVHFIRTFCI